jgi:hypothetical protein
MKQRREEPSDDFIRFRVTTGEKNAVKAHVRKTSPDGGVSGFCRDAVVEKLMRERRKLA